MKESLAYRGLLDHITVLAIDSADAKLDVRISAGAGSPVDYRQIELGESIVYSVKGEQAFDIRAVSFDRTFFPYQSCAHLTATRYAP